MWDVNLQWLVCLLVQHFLVNRKPRCHLNSETTSCRVRLGVSSASHANSSVTWCQTGAVIFFRTANNWSLGFYVVPLAPKLFLLVKNLNNKILEAGDKYKGDDEMSEMQCVCTVWLNGLICVTIRQMIQQDLPHDSVEEPVNSRFPLLKSSFCRYPWPKALFVALSISPGMLVIVSFFSLFISCRLPPFDFNVQICMYIANFSPAASVYTMIRKDERLLSLKERERKEWPVQTSRQRTEPGTIRWGAGSDRDVAGLTAIYLNWPQFVALTKVAYFGEFFALAAYH